MTTVWRRPIQASVESRRGSKPPARRSTRWPGVSMMRGLVRMSRTLAVSLGAHAGVGGGAAVGVGLGEDGGDVPVGVVVGEDRASVVGGRARGAEVASGGGDR